MIIIFSWLHSYLLSSFDLLFHLPRNADKQIPNRKFAKRAPAKLQDSHSAAVFSTAKKRVVRVITS